MEELSFDLSAVSGPRWAVQMCDNTWVCCFRQNYNAGKSCGWAMFLEVFMVSGKLSVWASAKVRECHSEVEQEDEY